MALVDYRGFRLLSMPLLPLKDIVYGSKDGGNSIHNQDNLGTTTHRICTLLSAFEALFI